MSHELGAAKSGKSHSKPAERQPSHAGKGHLVENIFVFTVIFGAFVTSMYMLNWFTRDNMWPMLGIVVVSFLAFYIPQGILGRSDTGYDLAEGNQSDEKQRGTTVDS